MNKRALPFCEIFLVVDLDVRIVTDVEYFGRFLHWLRLPLRVYLLHFFFFRDALWLNEVYGLVLVYCAVYHQLFTLVLRLLTVDLNLLHV